MADHMQGTPSPIPVWADGVYINQENDDMCERNHQVRLMSRIYSNCRTGLMYLGEETDGNESIGPTQHIVNAYYRQYKRHFQSRDWTHRSPASRRKVPPMTNWMGGVVSERYYVAHKSWRIWVVQEFALPQRIRMIYGNWEVAAIIVSNMASISPA